VIHKLIGNGWPALVDMLDAIKSAMAAGATDAQLAPALTRRAGEADDRLDRRPCGGGTNPCRSARPSLGASQGKVTAVSCS
jgi:hypothetical protein